MFWPLSEPAIRRGIWPSWPFETSPPALAQQSFRKQPNKQAVTFRLSLTESRKTYSGVFVDFVSVVAHHPPGRRAAVTFTCTACVPQLPECRQKQTKKKGNGTLRGPDEKNGRKVRGKSHHFGPSSGAPLSPVVRPATYFSPTTSPSPLINQPIITDHIYY